MRSRTASPTTTTRSCASCRASMARSRTSCARHGPGVRGAELPSSCASAAGSAAIATAIRSSPRTSAPDLAAAERPRPAHSTSMSCIELGAELSLDRALVSDLRRAAGAGGRARPTARRNASDEPYRRAITGMYARLAATAAALDRRRSAAACGRRRAALRRRGGVQGRPRHHRIVR